MRGLRRFLAEFIPVGQRWKWAGVVVFGAVVSVLEMLAAGLVFAVLSVVTGEDAELSLPLVGDVYSAFGPDRSDVVRNLSLLTAAVFLVRGGSFAFHHHIQVKLAFRAGVDLSERLFRRVMGQPYAWHTQQSSPKLASDVLHAVNQAVVQVVVPVMAGSAQVLIMAALFGLLVLTDPVATLAAAVLLGLVVSALLRGLRPVLTRLGVEQLEENKKSLQIAQESFAAIRDVKVLALGPLLVDRVRGHRQAQARAEYVASTLNALPRIVIETVAIGATLVFLAVTAPSGPSEAGIATLGLFAYALVRLLPTLTSFVRNVTAARHGVGALRIAMAQLDLPSGDFDDHADDGAAALQPPVDVRFDHVSFAYGDRPVLRDVSFTIPFGSTLGIVGPTGGGKSTLVDLLVGLLEPTEGRITAGSLELPTGRRSWQRVLGVVPQQVTIVDGSLQENLLLGVTEVEHDRLERAIDDAQLREVVASLPDGLATELGEGGVRLSGGQRQRVALARALYRNPLLLVLDEGTSALDNETEAAVIARLQRSDAERTLVMVAHRLSTIRSCDQILVLDGGVLAGCGSFDELRRSNDPFRRLLASGDEGSSPS